MSHEERPPATPANEVRPNCLYPLAEFLVDAYERRQREKEHERSASQAPSAPEKTK